MAVLHKVMLSVSLFDYFQTVKEKCHGHEGQTQSSSIPYPLSSFVEEAEGAP
jgi:hypothetical protein